MTPFRKQSTIPNNVSQREYMPTENNNELLLAMVVQTDYKNGIAKVAPTESGNYNVMNAQIPVHDFGFDNYGHVYGESRYLASGTMVLIGFIHGKTSNPIIIAAYPSDTSRYNEIAGSERNNDTDKDPTMQDILWTRKIVYPSQQVKIISGTKGNYIRTFNGRSFFQVSDDPIDRMMDISYDGEVNPDLRKKYGDFGKYVPDPNAQRMMLLHQSNSESDMHRTRFLIDKNGRVEADLFAFDDMNNLLRLDMSKDNGFMITKQFDTKDYGQSKLYSEFYITPSNHIRMVSVEDTKMGSIEVTADGTLIDGLKVATESNFQNLSAEFTTVQNGITEVSTTLFNMNPDYLKQLPDVIAEVNRNIGTNANKILSQQKDIDNAVADSGSASSKVDKFIETTGATITDSSNKVASITSRIKDYESNVTLLNTVNKTLADIKGTTDQYDKDKGNYLKADSKTITDIVAVDTQQTKDIKANTDAIAKINADTTLKTLTTAVADLTDKLKKMNENIGALATKTGTDLPNKNIF